MFAADEVGRYEIHLSGHLEARWSAWFDGMTVAAADGTTVISGLVADQAALYGLLVKVRDTGLPLVAVRKSDSTILADVSTHPSRRPE